MCKRQLVMVYSQERMTPSRRPYRPIGVGRLRAHLRYRTEVDGDGGR
jgi:hypothetical protein